MRRRTRTWLLGSIGAAVSGSAGAIYDAATSVLVTPDAYDIQTPEGLAAMKLKVGLSFVGGAVIGLAAYLKQSPIPTKEPTP